MMILSLVRNHLPSHEWVHRSGWNIADCVPCSFDLKGMDVCTIAWNRIGLAVLRRLTPFHIRLHYTDRRQRLPIEIEQQFGLKYQPQWPGGRSAPATQPVSGLLGDRILKTRDIFERVREHVRRPGRGCTSARVSSETWVGISGAARSKRGSTNYSTAPTCSRDTDCVPQNGWVFYRFGR